MSKLREKFGNVILNQDHNEQCEQITDDFAVKFSDWLEESVITLDGYFMHHGLIYNYKAELLQIYKDIYYE